MLFIARITAARTAQAASVAACRRVLLAWLCVLLVGGVTPWVKAGQSAEKMTAAPPGWGWERACSASGETRWIPSPIAQEFGAEAFEAQPAQTTSGSDAHWLDCPLCLPLLALPPLAVHSGRSVVAAAALVSGRYAQPVVQRSVVLPPSRAPPLVTSKVIAA